MSLTALFPSIVGPLPVTGGDALSPSDDFEVLGLALNAADLTGAVGGLTDFTLFAPTDQAFAELATSLGFTGDTTDANAVFGSIATALSGLAPDGDPIPLLTDILLYHVAPDSETLTGLNGAGPVTTLLSGATVQVTGGTVVDADPDATNADIVSADVDAGSGTVQVVNQVLLPVDTPVNDADPTLLDILKESGGAADDNAADFDLLLIALQATGLDVAADNTDLELTVFAPNDQAFVNLAQSLGYEGDDEAEALTTILEASAAADPENPLALVQDILEFHISPTEQDSTAVLASSEIETLQGTAIGVDGTTLLDQDPEASDPTLIATDLGASNGVAHVIDEVLLPIDLTQTEEDDTQTDSDGGHDDEDDDGFDWALLAGLPFLALLGLLIL